jgi:hypothetical protein
MSIDQSQTMRAEAPPAQRAQRQLIQMVQGYWVTQIVAVIARLRVPDHLAGGPRSGDELSEATGANADALRRLLFAGVTIGLLRPAGADRFALGPPGELLRSTEGSLRDFAIALAAPSLYRPFERLYDAVLTGEPVDEAVLGVDVWRYLEEHPDEGATFARAMGNLSVLEADQISAHYDASRFKLAVDVGGSHGVLLGRLLAATPGLRGILFDKPNVVAEAVTAMGNRGLADRVTFVEGDFFSAVPSGGDLYVVKHVLHDWDDEHALRILECCRTATGPGGAMLVIEAVLPDEPGPSPASLMDMYMLVLGGRERTRAQYEALLRDAGYDVVQVTCTPSGLQMLEARAS